MDGEEEDPFLENENFSVAAVNEGRIGGEADTEGKPLVELKDVLFCVSDERANRPFKAGGVEDEAGLFGFKEKRPPPVLELGALFVSIGFEGGAEDGANREFTAGLGANRFCGCGGPVEFDVFLLKLKLGGFELFDGGNKDEPKAPLAAGELKVCC